MTPCSGSPARPRWPRRCARSARSAWATCGSASPRRPCRAASRSGCGSPPGCAAASAARCTSLTSRPPACTPSTSAPWSACSTGCWRPGRRSSSSTTTWTCWPPPTASSTWARARARTGGTSWRPGRPRTSPVTRPARPARGWPSTSASDHHDAGRAAGTARGLPLVPGPAPADVVGDRALGVVGGLVAGVLVDAGDVEVVLRAGAAAGQVDPGVRDDLLDRGDDLGVGGGPAGGDVVRAGAEVPGQLQERDGPAAVPDVAQVERVLGVHRGAQQREVRRGTADGGVDQLGRRGERVRGTAERAPDGADAVIDDLQAGDVGQGGNA